MHLSVIPPWRSCGSMFILDHSQNTCFLKFLSLSHCFVFLGSYNCHHWANTFEKTLSLSAHTVWMVRHRCLDIMLFDLYLWTGFGCYGSEDEGDAGRVCAANWSTREGKGRPRKTVIEGNLSKGLSALTFNHIYTAIQSLVIVLT